LFVQFANRVFNIPIEGFKKEYVALMGIRYLEDFYTEIGLPIRLSEINIDLNKIEEMAEKVVIRGPVGNLVKLDKDDAINIYRLAI